MTLGIKPVANLRGVGHNLQDHVIVSGVVYQYKGKMPDRPVDSKAVDAEACLSSGVDSPETDINLVLEQLPIATPEAAARFGAQPKEGFTIAPALVQPTSRGQVRLAQVHQHARRPHGRRRRGARTARRVNELSEDLIKERPDRLGGFAALPLPDVDGALSTPCRLLRRHSVLYG